MKRLLTMMLVMALTLSLVACAGSAQNSSNGTSNGTEKDSEKETSSNTTEDPNAGEGIGKVVPLTEGEIAYVQSQTTHTWLEMSDDEKDQLVVLIGRWLEETKGYIVENYDDLIAMLDRQMEQYARYGVNEGVYETTIDILDIKN